jgi:hypothetical protein
MASSNTPAPVLLLSDQPRVCLPLTVLVEPAPTFHTNTLFATPDSGPTSYAIRGPSMASASIQP